MARNSDSSGGTRYAGRCASAQSQRPVPRRRRASRPPWSRPPLWRESGRPTPRQQPHPEGSRGVQSRAGPCRLGPGSPEADRQDESRDRKSVRSVRPIVHNREPRAPFSLADTLGARRVEQRRSSVIQVRRIETTWRFRFPRQRQISMHAATSPPYSAANFRPSRTAIPHERRVVIITGSQRETCPSGALTSSGSAPRCPGFPEAGPGRIGKEAELLRPSPKMTQHG